MTEIDWEIRPFEPSDAPAIRTLLVDAFETEAEADLAEALRQDSDAEIELVAETKGETLGYIILSRMSEPAKALGLGPVATRKDVERQGVASSLIESALALASAHEWQLVFLLGNPAFYERFGFEVDAANAFASPYTGPYWQVTFLDEDEAPKRGRAEYAPAFKRFED